MATSPSVPRSQATVVTRPSTGAGQVPPTFIRMKLPVPKVALVMPRSKQAWPKRAACWSPMSALIGTPANGESPPMAPAATVANRPQDGRTVGRAAAGTSNRSHSSSDQRRTTMSKSMVREALVTSVANTPPRRPAAQVPEDPAVDGGEGEVRAGRDAALLEQPLHLGRREVGVEDESGLLADEWEVAGRRQARRTGRRSGGPARRAPGGGGRPSPGSRPRPSRAGW